MRSIPLTLALLAAALVLARGNPVDISYTLKVANADGNTVIGNQTAQDRRDAIYTALNTPQHRTGYIALPQTTAASEYYNDAVKQGSWFGVNVLDDWLSSADSSNYGHLKTNSKWSLGPAYVIQGGPHEVVGISANFTGPNMPGAMYYLVISRPAESTMLRYRIDPASIPNSWYRLTGAHMLGEYQDAPPLVEDGDSIAFVNFVPNDHLQTYQGQDIRTQFRIGPSLIDQVMSIPLWVEPPSPPEGVAVPIMRLVSTGGEWLDTSDYLYYETSDEGMFLYSLVNTGTETKVFAEFLRHRI